LIDALHQITSQALTSFGCLIIGTDQFRSGDQNGVQVTCGGQCHRATGHHSVQRREYMFALKHEGIWLSDLVEHPNIQLHHTGIPR
jgi:hypothetical protein